VLLNSPNLIKKIGMFFSHASLGEPLFSLIFKKSLAEAAGRQVEIDRGPQDQIISAAGFYPRGQKIPPPLGWRGSKG
jgi:hypothetical protein